MITLENTWWLVGEDEKQGHWLQLHRRKHEPLSGLLRVVFFLHSKLDKMASFAERCDGMAKRKRDTPGVVERRLAEGRGQGEGADYKPFVRVQDLSSTGRSTRTSHPTNHRVAHQLSDIETGYRFVLEWSDMVVDIREQFNLELDITLEIARSLGIKHPTHPKTKEFWPITSDFVITTKEGRTIVSTVKPSNSIKDRDIEKFEIERAYWTDKGADWGMVTEEQFPDVLNTNLKFVRKAYDLTDYLIPEAQVNRIRQRAATFQKHVLGGNGKRN